MFKRARRLVETGRKIGGETGGRGFWCCLREERSCPIVPSNTELYQKPSILRMKSKASRREKEEKK